MKTKGQRMAEKTRQQCNKHTSAERAALIALGFSITLQGCMVTGSFEYTDPQSGATASLGVNHEFKRKPKSTADGKTVKPIEK